MSFVCVATNVEAVARKLQCDPEEIEDIDLDPDLNPLGWTPERLAEQDFTMREGDPF